MDPANTLLAATQDAALSSLHKQILANAKQLLPEVVKKDREERGTVGAVKASKVCDIVTFTPHTHLLGEGDNPGVPMIKAALTCGARDNTPGTTAMAGTAEVSRLAAMRTLLKSTEGLLRANGRALFEPADYNLTLFQAHLVVRPAKVDAALLAGNTS